MQKNASPAKAAYVMENRTFTKHDSSFLSSEFVRRDADYLFEYTVKIEGAAKAGLFADFVYLEVCSAQQLLCFFNTHLRNI